MSKQRQGDIFKDKTLTALYKPKTECTETRMAIDIHERMLIKTAVPSEAERSWSPLYHDSPCHVSHLFPSVTCCVPPKQELGISSWLCRAVPLCPKASMPILLSVSSAAQMQAMSHSSCSPRTSLLTFSGCKQASLHSP